MEREAKKFEDLVGLKLKRVIDDGESITFQTIGGAMYQLYHQQDCCESVRVEDIIGDLKDLEQSKILMAEEVSDNEIPEDKKKEGWKPAESFTWTFYKLGTIKGYVTIRFLGESNGYYSESVSFRKIK